MAPHFGQYTTSARVVPVIWIFLLSTLVISSLQDGHLGVIMGSPRC